MKRGVFIINVICLTVGLTLVTQGQVRRTYPYKTTEYFGAGNKQLPGPTGAKFRLDYTYRDSLSGSVRQYNETGKLVSVTPYAMIDRGVVHGIKTTYFESGELRAKEDYYANKRHGEFVAFSKDGKIKRREKYVNDVRASGECYDAAGQVIPFFEYEVMPRYLAQDGGLPAIVRAVAMKVKYPMEALMKQTEGRVLVTFEVNTVGQVENVQVAQGVSAALDAEALRAVKTLEGFTPGQLDGEAMTVSFAVPVTFRIQ